MARLKQEIFKNLFQDGIWIPSLHSEPEHKPDILPKLAIEQIKKELRYVQPSLVYLAPHEP